MPNKPEEQTNQTSALRCPASSIADDFNPLSAAQIANPYPFFARARKEEPIFFSSLANAWVVTRYDDVQAILKDYTRFSSVRAAATAVRYTPETIKVLMATINPAVPTLGNIDPPAHTRIRSCVSEVFTPKGVARLEPRIRAFADQLIDQFIKDGEMEILQQFAYPYPARIILSLIGIPEAVIEQARVWARDFFELFFSNLPPEQQTECARSVVALQQYLRTLIEQSRRNPQDDLASDLVKAIDAGQAELSDEELVQIFCALVIAGFETSASLLTSCLYYLLSTPQHWQAIVHNPTLIPAAIEETLRLAGPALGFFRVATQDVTIGEVTLPKGSRILVSVGSANHDEAYFQDPEIFNPHRENLGPHLAFGYGIHFCLGAHLARLDVRIALEQFSQRLPNLRLKPEQEISYVSNIAKRCLKHLYIQWDI
jgi:cytochrome P450